MFLLGDNYIIWKSFISSLDMAHLPNCSSVSPNWAYSFSLCLIFRNFYTDAYIFSCVHLVKQLRISTQHSERESTKLLANMIRQLGIKIFLFFSVSNFMSPKPRNFDSLLHNLDKRKNITFIKCQSVNMSGYFYPHFYSAMENGRNRRQ